MKTETAEAIEKIVTAFAEKKIPEVPDLKELKEAYPFHTAFFPDEAFPAFYLERRVTSSMGTALYKDIAKLVAQEKFNDVHVNRSVSGKAPQPMVRVIDRIFDGLRQRQRKPDLDQEWNEVLNAENGRMINLKVTSDVYIGDYKPGPLHLELKSPKPNLDQIATTKKIMWHFRLMHLDDEPQSFLGLTYNPYIKRKNYKWWVTPLIMDMKNEVLIGREVWDAIGGKGTFDELQRIFQETRAKMSKAKQDTLF